jgi:carbon monoxide dehydrogenase subunit G
MTYQGRHEFPVPVSEMWEIIQEVDQFEGWWPWLEDFTLVGSPLRAGSVLTGVAAPPLPYRMRLQVELTRCEAPCAIEASIHGDLEGKATLELHQRGTGTEVDVTWTVEMMQAPMRMADRLAHPVLQWGHDRVVEITIAGFRKRLTSTG